MRSLVLSAIAAVAVGTSARSEVAARVWMLDHPDANMDQLSELKDENPDAYALVKALLMKRSLGLLDPRHPTASFAKPAPDADSTPRGAAVYAKFATTEKEKAALQGTPYEEVASPAAQSHDWLNWKPKDSATDDDAMVKNVLGQVAGLAGGAQSKASDESSGSLEADEASILAADDEPKAKPTQPPAAPVVQTQPPAQNFLSKTPQPSEAPKVETPKSASLASENSYLKGLDLTTDDSAPPPPAPTAAPEAQVEPVKPMKIAAASPLDHFSFDGEDTQVVTTTVAPKAETAPAKPSALGSWLGLVKPHVQPAAKKTVEAAAPAQAENPYLADLS